MIPRDRKRKDSHTKNESFTPTFYESSCFRMAVFFDRTLKSFICSVLTTALGEAAAGHMWREPWEASTPDICNSTQELYIVLHNILNTECNFTHSV